jgi:hypothetical protein
MRNTFLEKVGNLKPVLYARAFFKQEFFGSDIALWLITFSLVANIINWAIIKIFIHPLDLPIILHYNVYLGVDMMGDYRRAYFLPLIGTVLFIVNWLLSIFLYQKKERIASYLLLIAVLMIQLSLIISSISVIIINY